MAMDVVASGSYESLHASCGLRHIGDDSHEYMYMQCQTLPNI